MSRLRRVNYMCSSTVSDTANRLLKRTNSEGSSSAAEKKSSAVLLFRSGHMSAICARLGSKGKVGVQRGRETAGVPSFLPPPRGAARPRWVGAEKGAARTGRTRLRQFVCPGFPMQEKKPPGQGEHANAVRAPRSAGAEKAAAPFGRTACAVRVPLDFTLISYYTEKAKYVVPTTKQEEI